MGIQVQPGVNLGGGITITNLGVLPPAYTGTTTEEYSFFASAAPAGISTFAPAAGLPNYQYVWDSNLGLRTAGDANFSLAFAYTVQPTNSYQGNVLIQTSFYKDWRGDTCPDPGMAIWPVANGRTSPQWAWTYNSSRIASQTDCAIALCVYGTAGPFSATASTPISGGWTANTWYTMHMWHLPFKSATITQITYGLNDWNRANAVFVANTQISQTLGSAAFYVGVASDNDNATPGGVIAANSTNFSGLRITSYSSNIVPTPTYTVTTDVGQFTESGQFVITVVTTNLGTGTLYYTLNGKVTATDFNDSTVSGSISVTNDRGTVTKVATQDYFTEGSEVFVVELRTDSVTGPIVAVSAAVVLLDTSVDITAATISPNVTVASEGSNVKYTVSTTGFGNGSLYWTNAGNTSAADFTDSANSGTVTITNDSGTIYRGLVNDLLTEGTETIALQLRTLGVTGNIIANANVVTVRDTSGNITATITPNVSTVSEGNTVAWGILTSGLGTGVLYYTNSGNTAAADFVDSTNSGSVTITNDSGEIVKTVRNDFTAEGTESIIMQLRASSIVGPILATANTVTVLDTSNTPTYAITPNVSTVGEGNTVAWTITTQGFGNGTLYYTNSGNTAAEDFVDGFNYGTVTITNDTGQFTKTLLNDVLLEGTESIIMQLRTGSIVGTVMATADTVQVLDTSVPATYAITPNVTVVNENQIVRFTVSTTNFGTGSLFWNNYGTTSSSDFQGNINNGTVFMTNDSGFFDLTIIADAVTEGPETIAIKLRSAPVFGTNVATANVVTVNDTSYGVLTNANWEIGYAGPVSQYIVQCSCPNNTGTPYVQLANVRNTQQLQLLGNSVGTITVSAWTSITTFSPLNRVTFNNVVGYSGANKTGANISVIGI
jgi:hypothetical protein